MRTRLRALLLTGAILGSTTAFAPPAAVDVAADRAEPAAVNMENVTNLMYLGNKAGGTDQEFTTLTFTDEDTGLERTAEVAVAGSYNNGMHLFDVTDPENVTLLGRYDCDLTQGDIQIFTRDDQPGRTFVTYTSDTAANVQSGCYREAKDLGFKITAGSNDQADTDHGTFIVDITDPYAPTTVSFVHVPQGSHNQTVHPSGRYLYNSNSDLITSPLPAIEVFDITDLSAPSKVGELALPTVPGLGTESHDITFNEDGSRAYSAAISQTVIIDTEDPTAPSVVTTIIDPTINVSHQSDPFTMEDPNYGEATFLIIEDEFAGATGTGQCPNGGFHVYDITDETVPVKVGYWNIGDIGKTRKTTGGCTAHVFQIHEEELLMTVAYYNGGVRVVDISGLVGLAFGDTGLMGMREVASYVADNSNSWSFKTNAVSRTEPFYVYSNDRDRAFDVYRVDISGEGAMERADAGVWMTPEELVVSRMGAPTVDLTTYKLNCLLTTG